MCTNMALSADSLNLLGKSWGNPSGEILDGKLEEKTYFSLNVGQ